MNSWIFALKEWNKAKGGKYVVPKKNTKEYNEVKLIQSKVQVRNGGFILPMLASAIIPSLVQKVLG